MERFAWKSCGVSWVFIIAEIGSRSFAGGSLSFPIAVISISCGVFGAAVAIATKSGKLFVCCVLAILTMRDYINPWVFF